MVKMNIQSSLVDKKNLCPNKLKLTKLNIHSILSGQMIKYPGGKFHESYY